MNLNFIHKNDTIKHVFGIPVALMAHAVTDNLCTCISKMHDMFQS